ncbi:hypothetical protein DFJ74DRAFT_320338 [Hyaloraphidium curvatum]|nr:hypothetical protein DFJ74DRAFT_320338 [Hyaloraphidium curvatum]
MERRPSSILIPSLTEALGAVSPRSSRPGSRRDSEDSRALVGVDDANDGRRKSESFATELPAPPPPEKRRTCLRTKCGVRPLIFDSAHLGAAFCLLFLAYGIVQAFLTTLFPDDGFFSLALIYGFFGVASLLAPTLSSLPPLGGDSRLAMVVGASLYVLFMVSVGVKNSAFLLASSATMGIGAALLWVNQGVFLGSVARKNAGVQDGEADSADQAIQKAVSTANGTFWALFNVSGILGNSIGLAILGSGSSTDVMVWTFVGISVVALVLLFLADPAYREDARLSAAATDGKQPGRAAQAIADLQRDMAALRRLIFTRLIALLLPLFILQSCTQVFNFGVLPYALAPGDGGPRTLSIVFLCYSAASTVSAPFSARMLGWPIGWAVALPFLAVFLAGEYALVGSLTSGLLGPGGSPSRVAALAFAGVFGGLFDATLNNALNILLMLLSSRRRPRPGGFPAPKASTLFATYKAANCLLGFVPMSIAARMTRPTEPWQGSEGWWAALMVFNAAAFLAYAGCAVMVHRELAREENEARKDGEAQN